LKLIHRRGNRKREGGPDQLQGKQYFTLGLLTIAQVPKKRKRIVGELGKCVRKLKGIAPFAVEDKKGKKESV